MNIFVLDLTLLCQKMYYACVFSWMFKKYIYINDNKGYDFTLHLLLPFFLLFSFNYQCKLFCDKYTFYKH